MSARDFAPVFLPAGREVDGKLSVTFGRHENTCSRSGFLYLVHKGGSATHEMERGTALHRILQLATETAVEQGVHYDQHGRPGAAMVPPEVVKAIANEVLADPAYRCPIEEHDYIRESAYRWAEEVAFDPGAVIACETMFVLEVGGFRMRGKIDMAERLEDGAAVLVWDYKSSRAMPSFEDLGRKRPDGSIAAKDYQLVLYALLLAFGVPVRVEECPTCGGSGEAVEELTPQFDHRDPRHETREWPCPTCNERGEVEIPEPFGVAEQAQRFDLAYVFPGINAGGEMGKRTVSLTRLELHEYLASLEAQMARVAAALESGSWPATSGAHCNECPCRAQCPIPAELRQHAGTINTVEEAAEAAEQLDREKARHKARWDEIRAFVKARVPGQRLRFGRDQVIEPTVVVKTVIRDKDAMWEAVERARKHGDPFDRAQFEKVQTSTPISQRRLTEEELAVEAGTTSEGSR